MRKAGHEVPSSEDRRDAAREVRYAIANAAEGGGLVIACSNVLQPGTQLENYLAGRQATRELGAYSTSG